MNMISEKQNEEQMLALQYAAKQFYNRAEKYDLVEWIICFLSVGLTIIQTVFDTESFVGYLVAGLLALGILTVQLFVKRFTNKAAALKQLFDYQLFGFDLPDSFGEYSEEKLYQFAKREKNRNPQKYHQQISATGTSIKRGVKDWYEIDKETPSETAIRKCQCQNFNFDSELADVVKIITLVVFVCAILLFTFFYFDRTVSELLKGLITLAPIIEKSFSVVKSSVEMRDYIVECKSKNILSEKMTVKERQMLIDKRRRIIYIVPDFLHQILSQKLHDEIEDNFDTN